MIQSDLQGENNEPAENVKVEIIDTSEVVMPVESEFYNEPGLLVMMFTRFSKNLIKSRSILWNLKFHEDHYYIVCAACTK